MRFYYFKAIFTAVKKPQDLITSDIIDHDTNEPKNKRNLQLQFHLNCEVKFEKNQKNQPKQKFYGSRSNVNLIAVLKVEIQSSFLLANHERFKSI